MYGIRILSSAALRKVIRIRLWCRRQPLLILLAFLSVHPTHVVARESEGTEHGPSQSDRALKTAEQALRHSQRALGVENGTIDDSTAELVDITRHSTPFLYQRIIGTQTWRIRGSVTKLKLQDVRWPKNGEEFEALIDPVTKAIYTVEIVTGSEKSRTWKTPAPKDAEDQMRRASDEKYTSFADAPPSVDVLTALDSVRAVGGRVDSAVRIAAVCVVRETKFKTAKLVWAVTLMGVPPIRRTPPGGTTDPVYTYRYIVDATTGVCESISNRPR